MTLFVLKAIIFETIIFTINAKKAPNFSCGDEFVKNS